MVKGGIMISSPCKNCPKRDLPKKDCAKDCKLLNAIQDLQMTAEESGVSSRLDYTEGMRYDIPSSIKKASMSLHMI
jgi:hypothetical protein